MVVSNSGRMRKLKDKIRIALNAELLFDMVQGAVVTSRFTLDDLDKIFKKNENEMYNNILKNNIKIFCLKRDDILDNPYLKNISIKEEQIGNMVYSNKRRIRTNTLALYSEDERDLDNYFLKKEYFVPERVVDVPILHEKDKTVAWMSIEPHEVRTLDKFINEAYGNVLICGCGLGYTAYMLALKKNVSSITIIEKNEDIIELFKNQVFSKIPNNDRINIIKCDANDYLNNSDLSIYDYINVDLWYDTFDMVYPYLKCLMLESKYPNTHFTYWIEQSLFVEIQRELLSFVADEKFTDNVSQVSDISRGIVSVSHDLINNQESLNNFISFDNIRKRLLEWAINNVDVVEKMGADIEEQEEMLTTAVTKLLSRSKNY